MANGRVSPARPAEYVGEGVWQFELKLYNPVNNLSVMLGHVSSVSPNNAYEAEFKGFFCLI